MARETVLITGGAGFIGSHTADALAKKGYRVRIMDNLAPPVHAGAWPNYLKNKGFELMRGDVRKKADLAKALKGVSYVYHFAAYQDQRPDFGKFFETNTVSSALLFELILEKKLPIKKIVFASTQFVYGDGEYECRHTGKRFFPQLRSEKQLKNNQFEILCSHGKPAKFIPFKEDQPLAPPNAYSLSKEGIEHLALQFGKTYGIPVVVLRYSPVQGSRQSPRNLYSGVMRIYTVEALKKQPIAGYEDGKQMRDFVNVHDVVQLNLLVLKNKKADFQIFNVGSGVSYRVGDFAVMVKKITGSPSPIVRSGFRRTDARHAVSDISKVKRLLHWKPRKTPADSIREYVHWLTTDYWKHAAK